MKNLTEAHQAMLDAATAACRTRSAFSPFPEQPGLVAGAADASAQATARFLVQSGQPFVLDLPGVVDSVGDEVSPYTQQPLQIGYPRADVDALFTHARAAMHDWARAPIARRLDALLDVVDAHSAALFDFVPAIQHTTGQSAAMAYAGSGTNALDRALEAIVMARDAMAQVPDSATWQRTFGKETIALQKRYRIMPRGVAVCFACATFPTWNAWPSMMASLATGNAVIVKPHPAAVLPMAMSVRLFRAALANAGFDPNLVTLAVDTVSEPIGKRLVEHPACAIVDFTGGAGFGAWVEQNGPRGLTFTETAGVNTVVLDSCDDLAPVLRSLATTLCLFSAQMCTSPQNVYVPEGGVRVGRGDSARLVPADEVERALVAAIDALVAEPKRAASICATIQSAATLALLAELSGSAAGHGLRVLRSSAPYAHPEASGARTATPLVLGCDAAARAPAQGERFGPVAFVIRSKDSASALVDATSDVRKFGGLTAFLYSTDEAFIAAAEDAYAAAGAQLSVNLTGPMPLNFAAAYSDVHVTGLNPAGTASLTDLSFVANRFRIAQARRPLTSSTIGAVP